MPSTEPDVNAALEAYYVDQLIRAYDLAGQQISAIEADKLDYLEEALQRIRINQGRAATLNANTLNIAASIADVETTPVAYQVGAGPVLPGFQRSYWKTDTNPPTQISTQLLDANFNPVAGANLVASSGSSDLTATYNTNPTVLTDGQTGQLQLTENQALKVYETGNVNAPVTTEHVILTTSGTTTFTVQNGVHHSFYAAVKAGTMTVDVGGVVFSYDVNGGYSRTDEHKIPFANDFIITAGPQLNGADSEVYITHQRVAAGGVVI